MIIDSKGMIPKIKIPGKSGCDLEILESGGRILVRKKSYTIEYNQRLFKQGQKQAYFLKLMEHSKDFTAPSIIQFDDIDNNSLYTFVMEYVCAESFDEYLDHVSVDEIDNVIEKILRFINQSIMCCELAPSPKIPLTIKVQQVRTAIKNNKLVDQSPINAEIDSLLQKIPDADIPLGFCHGDLTFSNMLFTQKKINFIDFLDSFIESPYLDIIKLKQDTKYKWTLNLIDNLPTYRKNRLTQIMDYFDNRINCEYQTNTNFLKWQEFLEKLNMLRILPYLSSINEIKFVESCLFAK